MGKHVNLWTKYYKSIRACKFHSIQGLAYVIGFYILPVNTYISIRDSYVMDRYLPREMMMKIKFIVFNRCVSSIKSADGCYVIFC